MKDSSAGNRLGQSVVEILIAIAVIATAVSSVILVAFGNQAAIIDSQNHIRALQLAKTNLEEVKANARQSFASAAASSATEDIFLKEILVEDITPYEKKVISRVSWTTDPLRPQKEELTTIITDPIAILAQGGDDGGGGTTGDWQNPRTLGSVDLGPGNSATGLDVINKIIYMSAEASAAAKPDFFIINATSGQTPFVASSINTGPSLNAVDAAGDYAYVANKDVDAQLQIVNVSNILLPLISSSFKLPGVSGTGAVGHSIFYHNSNVYIGTKQATGPEFHIVGVSDQFNPAAMGDLEINGDVNSIFIGNNYAYLATSLDSKEIMILDISDPGDIDEIGFYNLSGSSDAKSLYLLGGNLLVGRAGGELVSLDVADPGSIQPRDTANIGADINGIVSRDDLSFLGTSDSNREFQVWNIEDPENIVLWSYFNFPQVVTDLDYEDNIVYAAVRSNDALRIITSN